MRKFLFIYLALFGSIVSAVAQNMIVVNADQGKETISRHIYGHFSEHLGACIYGGFYVGDSSQVIPNTRGIRKDVVEALKKIKIPNLRWPGGCFADTYHWKDGIGAKNKRPTMVNSWWGGITENNSFGTHEFMDLCEQLGAEPYISANVGSGTVQDVSDWVQYVNFDGVSPMSKLRAENGHAKPWSVKFWGVGNEAWGCGGNMRVEYYADVYRKYATFMTETKGAKPFRIASGASSDNYHWTEVLMREIPSNLMEGVALHHYSVIDWNKKGSASAFSEQEYFATMQQALRMEEFVTKHSEIMDKYDPTKKIALVVDEWGGWYDVEPGTNGAFLFQQNTLRDAMIAGTSLNIFNNHCDRVRVANLAQVVNVLQAVVLTNKEKMLVTPTYHVMEMYTVHHDATMLPTQVQSSDFVEGTNKLPAISASASKQKDGTIHISVVNINSKSAQEVKIELKGGKFSAVSGRILTSDKIQNHNTFDKPNAVVPVAFKGASLKDGVLKATLPPFSVVVLEVK